MRSEFQTQYQVAWLVVSHTLRSQTSDDNVNNSQFRDFGESNIFTTKFCLEINVNVNNACNRTVHYFINLKQYGTCCRMRFNSFRIRFECKI